MDNDSYHHSDAKFLTGLFVGGIVGALVIFFLGTKEGKKAGRMLQKKGEDILDDIEGKVGDLEEKGKELLEKGEEIKEKVLAEIEERKDDFTQDAAKRLDTALASVEKVQEKGLSSTASLRKQFRNLPKK